jgi:hypothetical protein
MVMANLQPHNQGGCADEALRSGGFSYSFSFLPPRYLGQRLTNNLN